MPPESQPVIHLQPSVVPAFIRLAVTLNEIAKDRAKTQKRVDAKAKPSSDQN